MWERRFPAIVHILIGTVLLLTAVFPAYAQEVTHVPQAVFEPGSVGLGAGIRLQDSPYKADKTRTDLVPQYLMETEYVFGYGTYGGIHLFNTDTIQLDIIAQYRFDLLDPADSAFLRGMEKRKQSVDAGALFTYKTQFGDLSIKWVHDILNHSKGYETTLAYGYNWFVNRLLIRPSIGVSWLSRDLADYYYGVRQTEATPTRPAYRPGASTNILLGIETSYFVTPRLLAFADWKVRNFDGAISDSPIVGENLQNNLYFGAAYVFGSYKKFDETGMPERTPTYLRFGGGWGSKCTMMSIIVAGCWASDPDRTSILNFQIGKPLVEKFLDWPLDFVAKLGINRHLENGMQDDFNSYTASVKAYYYGFPWREYVMTRVGLGFGLSYAERIPITEQRSLAEQGKNTSHLLNYMDPSIDVSVGDIIRYEPLSNTFFGFAVSHRSGIFGTSDILGNVNGGSNYIVMYLEAVI